MRSILLSFFILFSLSSFAQLNLELVGHFEYPDATLAGCWHYTHADGTPYAIVGTSKGISYIDLTDPTTPVEQFMVPSLPNNWREVKTHGDYAYATTEANGSGIQIMDMTGLPDTVVVTEWFGDSSHLNMIQKSHALAIEDGFMYLFGGGQLTNGAVICDLADPLNPTIVGQYTDFYIHDGYVRNDTLWSAEIFDGQFSVVDVSDKANPVLLASTITPGAFTHNTWLSDNSEICFTTDEKPDAPLTSYRITDVDDIELLDTYYPSQKPEKEVHNTRVLGRYLINAAYGGQLTIVDAKRPANLVETAWTIMGQALVWDADPYLSDSLIFATEKLNGLFIYKPTYTPAAWLEGEVSDALTGLTLPSVDVQLVELGIDESSKNDGLYKTGTVEGGNYTVIASKQGYIPDTVYNVALVNDQVTILDFELMSMQVSTTSLDESPIRISPTMFSAQLNIELPQAIQSGVAELISADGKLVEQMRFSSASFTWNFKNNSASGNYLVRIHQGRDVVHIQKVIKY